MFGIFYPATESLHEDCLHADSLHDDCLLWRLYSTIKSLQCIEVTLSPEYECVLTPTPVSGTL